MSHPESTIFAPATAPGKAGVAIVRVSGPAAVETFTALTDRGFPNPREMTVAVFKDPSSQKIIDLGMAVFFENPRSFTGEDVVEYHLHGGRAVVEGLLRALSNISGCRMAEPGEFTRRAFENGKLDLTEAEAVADLIAAETESQRTQALDQLGGALSELYTGWAELLKKTAAHQEADIEFPEDDMPSGIAEELKADIKRILQEVKAHLDDGRRGERLRDGILIAILGAPNAGKSSLLNALARREVAIVSEEAGTTRDILEAHLDLGGYPVILADTAGLRETTQAVEKEGIRRAKKLAGEAALKVVLFDSTQSAPDPETFALIDKDTVIVLTKKDLGGSLKVTKAGCDVFMLSAATGEGLDVFIKGLTKKVAELFTERTGPSLTRARHREALEETAASLERCLSASQPELAAEDLRLALRALGKITGRVHVEDLLDAIFRDFCIGK